MKQLKQIVIFLGVTLLIGTAIIGFEVFTTVTIPKIETEFNTGVTDYFWEDRKRPDPDTGKARKLIVRAWYPTDVDGPGANYHPRPDLFSAHINEQYQLPEVMVSRLANSQTNSVLDASITKRKENFPVLIFSHGLNGSRVQNSHQMEYLAGTGYVIFSIEHTHASSGTELPEEGEMDYLKIDGMPDDDFADSLVNVWSDDQLFVLNMLDSLKSSPGNPVFSQLDLTKVGLFGHSFGGNATARTLSKSDRFLTGINLDGYYFGYGYKEPFAQPFLEIRAPWPAADTWSDEDLEQMNMNRKTLESIPENWDRRLKQYALNGATRVTISESDHMMFSDFYLLVPFRSVIVSGYEDRYRYSAELVKNWFDYHMLETATDLIRPSESIASEVTYFN